MALVINDWISPGVSAAGLNAAIDGAETAGSSVPIGGRLGGDINTGWFEFGLVARGEVRWDGSLGGVRLGGVLKVGAVMGVLRVETEEVE